MLLAHLTKDLKRGNLPSNTIGRGIRKKNKKRDGKKRIILPPPGIPDSSTPPARETHFRDLSKNPPLVEAWEDY